MSKFLFSLENLNVGYSSDSPILKNLNLIVNSNEIIAITGKNGSGKSTLIRTISNLLKPLSGQILTKNHFKVSLVPQLKKINLSYPLSVEEILKLPMELESYFFKKVKFNEIQLEVLEKLGINSIRNKLLKECSGGQIQKVLLARSLIGSSDLIILDEPLDALDWKARELVFKIFMDKVMNSNVSLLIITHNLDEEWMNHFTKLLVTEDGNLKEGKFGKSL
jgi:ABC-type Mn2+/Zn2+ transport system ATPase subunit